MFAIYLLALSIKLQYEYNQSIIRSYKLDFLAIISLISVDRWLSK